MSYRLVFFFLLLTFIFCNNVEAAGKNSTSSDNTFMQLIVPNMYYDMRSDPPLRHLPDDVVLLFAECVARKQYASLSVKDRGVLEGYAKKFWNGRATVEDDSSADMTSIMLKLQSSWKPSKPSDLIDLEPFCPTGIVLIRKYMGN